MFISFYDKQFDRYYYKNLALLNDGACGFFYGEML